VDVECDSVQELTTIRIHLYCRQRSKTLARLPPEYLIGGFLRYVDQHYPLHHNNSPPVETVLVTTTLAAFYRIRETVQCCDSEQDRRLFHAHFRRWADLSCLLRRKMFGVSASLKVGTDAARLLAELAMHMRLPAAAAADPLCVIQNAFEQFFPLAPLQQTTTEASPPPLLGCRRLENDEELERHLEPVSLSADSLNAHSPVLLHISLIKTVIEYAGKSFPSLGAISCMEARRRRPALFLINPARPEGKVELNSAARAGFAVHSSRCPRPGRYRDSLVWEDGSRGLLSEEAALQALLTVLKIAAENAGNGSEGGVLLIAARRDRSLGVLLAALARHDLLMAFRDIVKG
jgi:hypothetical protein